MPPYRRRKSGAKVLLFFQLTKYFRKKMQNLCIFSQKEGQNRPSFTKNTYFLFVFAFFQLFLYCLQAIVYSLLKGITHFLRKQLSTQAHYAHVRFLI